VDTGSHDPKRLPFALPGDMDPRVLADYADMDVIRTDDGSLVPAKLAHRELGWQGDRSHEEGFSERLNALYSRMDELSAEVAEWHRTGQADSARVISTAARLATAWRKIRKELQS
jgi:hypothetical protein